MNLIRLAFHMIWLMANQKTRQNLGCWFSLYESLNKYNKGIKYLLCAIDLFSKYAWVVPLKDKRVIAIVDAFQKIISEGRKSNKVWLIKVVNFTIIFFRDI